MMKNMLIFIFCFLVIELNAQHGRFIRVYNSNNQKFQKGYLHKTSDSGLVLTKKGVESEVIKYNDIYKIRMRRSAGLTTLIAGGIPITAGAVLTTRGGWGGLAGIILFMEGLLAGPIAGGIKATLNPKPIIIAGDQENWINCKKFLDQKFKKIKN